MFKTALFDQCDLWKILQCWRRTGHLPSFLVPIPGYLTAQESHPREFAIQGKMPWGQPEEGGGGEGGRAQLKLTDAYKAEIPPLAEIRM